MLEDFESMLDGHLGRISVYEHQFDLLKDKVRPLHSTLYRAGPTERKIVAVERNQMISKNAIGLATNKWAARIVFASRQDDSLCPWLVYRKLNAVTIRALCSLPRMFEWIHSLEERTVFSSLGGSSAYSQIRIDGRDHGKTAFTSYYGLYRLTRIPLRLNTATATF